MALQDGMDHLVTHMGDLCVMKTELRKYERYIIRCIGEGKPGREGIHSIAQTMLTTTNMSGSFFREQTEVTRKMSTSAAEQRDGIPAAYEDVQAIIEDKFQKESEEKGRGYTLPELIKSHNTHVPELGKHHGEMRKAMKLTYNCIVGAINFMVSDGTRKAGRRADRGGWKRIR